MKEKERRSKKLGKKISGTKEWADDNLNIQFGCRNSCKYCYAWSRHNRFHRNYDQDWSEEKINEKAFLKKISKIEGRFMFPSSHDITPENLELYSDKLKQVLEAGNKVLIVSKPCLFCIQTICNRFPDYKDKITFRFTIGSLNSEILKFWEPNAPTFEERFSALEYAYNNGFNTSISCEPMLDDKSVELAEILLPYVTDTLWFGKANLLKSRLSLNGYKDEFSRKKADELMAMHDDDYINALYEKFKDNSRIRWKDSIKEIVGIPEAEAPGLDI